jgi:hypothetical protein
MTEYFEPSSKIVRRGRGMAQKSLDLIEAMYAAAEAAQPITGRGIGYKLFTQGLIPSMGRADMQRVYRLLKEARERDDIPWDFIVDETRELERASSWSDPAEYVQAVSRSYRRDFWLQQPNRVEVWSEKGTVRGVLAPVLDEYGVGFRAVHGFSSATMAHAVSNDEPDRPLIVLYVGDFDPSGIYMSQCDLPARFFKYGGEHITLKRIALTSEQVANLPSFPAKDKRKDPRYPWFVKHYGQTCWELDALDPNDLREIVEQAIQIEIEPVAWKRCAVVEKASLRTVLDRVGDAMTISSERLPNRRLCESFSFELNGLKFTASIGRFDDGRIAEVFLNNHKAGNQSEPPESASHRARAAALLWRSHPGSRYRPVRRRR